MLIATLYISKPTGRGGEGVIGIYYKFVYNKVARPAACPPVIK